MRRILILVFILIAFHENVISQKLVVAEVYSDSFLVPLVISNDNKWSDFPCEPFKECNYNLSDSTWSFVNSLGRRNILKISGNIFQKQINYPENQKVGYPVSYVGLQKKSTNSEKIGIATNRPIPMTVFNRHDLRYTSVNEFSENVIDLIYRVGKIQFEKIKSEGLKPSEFSEVRFQESFEEEQFNIDYISSLGNDFDNRTYYHFQSTFFLGENRNSGRCIIGYGFVIRDMKNNKLHSIVQDFQINSCMERKTSEGFYPTAIFQMDGSTHILGRITNWDGYYPTVLKLGESIEYLLDKPSFEI